MDIGEKDLDNAMPWDEISNLSYTEWDLDFDKEYMIDISNKRILNDSILILIDENGKRMKEIRENTELSLNYADYKNHVEMREAESKKYERIGKDTLGLVIDVLQADLPDVLADTSKKARTDAWILNLKKDVYLSETINVLKDIDNYKTQNARKDD